MQLPRSFKLYIFLFFSRMCILRRLTITGLVPKRAQRVYSLDGHKTRKPMTPRSFNVLYQARKRLVYCAWVTFREQLRERDRQRQRERRLWRHRYQAKFTSSHAYDYLDPASMCRVLSSEFELFWAWLSDLLRSRVDLLKCSSALVSRLVPEFGRKRTVDDWFMQACKDK